jgi:hypothetical protein
MVQEPLRGGVLAVRQSGIEAVRVRSAADQDVDQVELDAALA